MQLQQHTSSTARQLRKCTSVSCTTRATDLAVHASYHHPCPCCGRATCSADIAEWHCRNELTTQSSFASKKLCSRRFSLMLLQVRAVLRAAMLAQQSGYQVDIGIVVPMMASVAEFRHQAKLVKGCALTLERQFSSPAVYRLGTMISSPMTCLLAAEVAAEAEFLCLQTNQLLEQMYGMSHDEFRQFLSLHLQDSKPESDPFQVCSSGPMLSCSRGCSEM